MVGGPQRFSFQEAIGAAFLGVVAGLLTRVIFAGHKSVDQILSSPLGLIVLVYAFAGFGLTAMAIQHKLWNHLAMCLGILVCSVMWVIPLPH